MSHTSGTGDGFGFPGYAPERAAADARRRSSTARRRRIGAQVRLERPPFTGFKYSGGGVMIQQLALTDAIGKPFVEHRARLGARSARHDQQHLRAAAAGRARDSRPRARTTARARAWAIRGTSIPSTPRPGLWTTPTDLAKFAIEVQTVAARASRSGVLSRADRCSRWSRRSASARSPSAFSVAEAGRGLVLRARRQQLGLPVRPDRASRRRATALVIMTNGDAGGA